jgi:hypothetical protein
VRMFNRPRQAKNEMIPKSELQYCDACSEECHSICRCAGHYRPTYGGCFFRKKRSIGRLPKEMDLATVSLDFEPYFFQTKDIEVLPFDVQEADRRDGCVRVKRFN